MRGLSLVPYQHDTPNKVALGNQRCLCYARVKSEVDPRIARFDNSYNHFLQISIDRVSSNNLTMALSTRGTNVL